MMDKPTWTIGGGGIIKDPNSALESGGASGVLTTWDQDNNGMYPFYGGCSLHFSPIPSMHAVEQTFVLFQSQDVFLISETLPMCQLTYWEHITWPKKTNTNCVSLSLSLKWGGVNMYGPCLTLMGELFDEWVVWSIK